MIPLPALFVGGNSEAPTAFITASGACNENSTPYLTTNSASYSISVEAAGIANNGKKIGKWYFEIAVYPGASFTGSLRAGLTPNNAYIPSYAASGGGVYGSSGYGVLYDPVAQLLKDADTFGTIAYGAAGWGGQVIQCAVDLTANKVWFGFGGTFSGNPAAGTGAEMILNTTYYPVAEFTMHGSQTAFPAKLIAINATPASLAYTPPTGFAPWQ